MSATWKVEQTSDAKRDHVGIIRWTAEHFGPHQARIYNETLNLSLAALCDGPDVMGVKKRDDIAPDILTLHVARNGRKGRHFIVFRISRDRRRIEILRLLHDAMDLSTHL